MTEERPLRDPAHERSGPTVDAAVANAEEGSQVDGVHTPSGQAESGDSRAEHMTDEPVQTDPETEQVESKDPGEPG